MRYITRVAAYLYLGTETYPPSGGDEGAAAVTVASFPIAGGRGR